MTTLGGMTVLSPASHADMHANVTSMVAIQIRDVTKSVRDDLAREARARGLSLQAYLRDVLEHEARVARNRELLRTFTPVRGTFTGEPIDVPSLIAAGHAERDQRIADAMAGRS